MTHTKEPWYDASEKVPTMYGVGADRDGSPCMILTGNHNFPDAEANEARARVCVNALAGIPDPAAFVARAKRIEAIARECVTWMQSPPLTESDRYQASEEAKALAAALALPGGAT